MARKQNLPTWPSSRRQFHEAIDVIGCNEYQASTGFHRPQRIKQGIAFRPWAEARSSIDMPGSLYKDEPASPCLGVLPSPLRINVAIIGTCNDYGWERQRAEWNWPESDGVLRIVRITGITWSHQQGTVDTLEQRCGRRHGPMHDQRTGRAMSRQNRWGGVLRHSLAKARNPILAMGCIPLALDYSLARGIISLPVTLPVVRPRVAEPREYQCRDFVIHMPGQVVSTEP